MKASCPPHCEKIRGSLHGPVIVILGGVHGDEKTGIEVIRELKDILCTCKEDIAGSIYLIIGNPKAVEKCVRSVSSARDLNRFFIHEDIESARKVNESYELTRARELAPILASADICIDLHATSNPSPEFVVCGKDTPGTLELFMSLPVKYMLTDPYNILAKDLNLPARGTTDYYVESFGGVAIGYETGLENETGKVQEVTYNVLHLLSFFKILRDEELRYQRQADVKGRCIYALCASVQAKNNNFHYADGMSQGWQSVTSGQLVGSYDDGYEERTPCEGMLLFPKAEKKVIIGKNLYYIAKKNQELLL